MFGKVNGFCEPNFVLTAFKQESVQIVIVQEKPQLEIRRITGKMRGDLLLQSDAVHNGAVLMHSIAKKTLIAEIQDSVKNSHLFQLPGLLGIISQRIEYIAKMVLGLEIHLAPDFPYQPDLRIFTLDGISEILPK